MFSRIKKLLFSNNNIRQTVAKNTFWLVFGEIVSRIIRLGLIAYAARVLGTEGWGIFSYALSAVGIFMAFSDFGLTPLLTKQTSIEKGGKNPYLSAVLYIKLWLLFATSILAIVFAQVSDAVPSAQAIIPLTAAILALDSIREFIIIIIRAQEKMEKEAMLRMVTNAAVAILGIVFLLHNPSPLSLASAYLIGSMIGTGLVFLSVRKQIASFLTSVSRETYKNMLGIIWPIAILGVSSSIMGSLSTIMVGWWRTAHDIGLYAADQRIVQFFYIIPMFFIGSLFPVLAKLYDTEKERFQKVLKQSLLTIFLIGLPLVIGGSVLSKDILVFLFGADYGQASIAFVILLGTILVMFPTTLLYNVAIIKGTQKDIAWISAAGIVCLVIISTVLIPRYGIAGAAASTLFAQLLILTGTWVTMRTTTPSVPVASLKNVFIASAAMAIVTLGLKLLGLHLLVNIACSSLAFFMSLYLSKDDTFLLAISILKKKDAPTP